ncbi:tyrosyl-DNA phosphodiesterase 2-like [Liolophura sinensis]|uniref:tyrosyl-DNA phosphodiesterase 2-like n=1 Tax=Liolophura sinensis TaxID=3198878 RepID=UPI0031582416
MSDSDSSDDANIPSREICEERCQRFAEITSTDTALAMFYLQDRDWDLDRSVNAFYEDTGDTSKEKKEESSPLDPEPHRIRLMSWNIDGLDSNNIKTRTKAVCQTIKKENPAVVFLQEVVPQTLSILEKECPEYQVLPGGQQGYFTAILIKVGVVVLEDQDIQMFYSSRMMRNLLSAKCRVKGVPCLLITSHLESTQQHAEERKKQLKIALEVMRSADEHRTAIFGGDLNLRDKELAEIGGLPDDVLDLWEVTGKRPEAKFTWDSRRNENISIDSKFRPCHRFDRLYLRHSKPKPKVKPVYFELIGIEKIPTCQRFPSDHWGLLAHFDITQFT